MNEKKLAEKVSDNEKSCTFAAALAPYPFRGSKDDSVAQQVEHNTFNVGVLGSSPSRVTNKQKISDHGRRFFVIFAIPKELQ